MERKRKKLPHGFLHTKQEVGVAMGSEKNHWGETWHEGEYRVMFRKKEAKRISDPQWLFGEKKSAVWERNKWKNCNRFGWHLGEDQKFLFLSNGVHKT